MFRRGKEEPGMGSTVLKAITFTPRRGQRVRVNLNAVTADGLIRVRTTRFTRPPRPGMQVVIFEPVDGIEGSARVVRVNERTSLVYLDVAWDTLHDALLSVAAVTPDAASVAATATRARLKFVPRVAR